MRCSRVVRCRRRGLFPGHGAPERNCSREADRVGPSNRAGPPGVRAAVSAEGEARACVGSGLLPAARDGSPPPRQEGQKSERRVLVRTWLMGHEVRLSSAYGQCFASAGARSGRACSRGKLFARQDHPDCSERPAGFGCVASTAEGRRARAALELELFPERDNAAAPRRHRASRPCERRPPRHERLLHRVQPCRDGRGARASCSSIRRRRVPSSRSGAGNEIRPRRCASSRANREGERLV
jgi:hypothetical protein